jgi:peptidoglycan hydrolase-like protein with peptidoglycan-binding domain
MVATKEPSMVDWDAIIRYFRDLRAQVDEAPIKRGARGLPVRLVQSRLNDRGFDAGVVDGIFGRRTKAAVRKFQESQGFLKVNGVVDGNTFGALFLQ